MSHGTVLIGMIGVYISPFWILVLRRNHVREDKKNHVRGHKEAKLIGEDKKKPSERGQEETHR